MLIVNLLFQEPLGFYGFLSYKAQFGLTMEFSEADTREEATKWNFHECTFRVIPLTSLGLSWLKPKFYYQLLQTQQLLVSAAQILITGTKIYL